MITQQQLKDAWGSGMWDRAGDEPFSRETKQAVGGIRERLNAGVHLQSGYYTAKLVGRGRCSVGPAKALIADCIPAGRIALVTITLALAGLAQVVGELCDGDPGDLLRIASQCL
jgi:hypothetical protein